MGWAETTRRQYCRAGRRDANALTDEEWAPIEPFMPVAKATGRPRTTELGGGRGRTPLHRLDRLWRALPRRKRHIITDTEGHLANGQSCRPRIGMERSASSPPFRQLYPSLRHLFADGGYAGETLTQALADLGTWTIESIWLSDAAKASRCCRDDGSSSELSPGSDVALGLPRTSRRPSPAQGRGSSSRPSASCCAEGHLRAVRNRVSS